MARIGQVGMAASAGPGNVDEAGERVKNRGTFERPFKETKLGDGDFLVPSASSEGAASPENYTLLQADEVTPAVRDR